MMLKNGQTYFENLTLLTYVVGHMLYGYFILLHNYIFLLHKFPLGKLVLPPV